jgi:hypothetical protein
VHFLPPSKEEEETFDQNTKKELVVCGASPLDPPRRQSVQRQVSRPGIAGLLAGSRPMNPPFSLSKSANPDLLLELLFFFMVQRQNRPDFDEAACENSDSGSGGSQLNEPLEERR